MQTGKMFRPSSPEFMMAATPQSSSILTSPNDVTHLSPHLLRGESAWDEREQGPQSWIEASGGTATLEPHRRARAPSHIPPLHERWGSPSRELPQEPL